jgi:hypothetical protein
MGRLTELDRILESVFEEDRIGDLLLVDGGYDFDLGIEIALLWLDKLSEHLSHPKGARGILQSVKMVFRNESLILLYKNGHGAVEVAFSDIHISDELQGALCGPNGFYQALANTRFTRCLKKDAAELTFLPPEYPKVYEVIAVPLFLDGVPSGCLAMVGTCPEGDFRTSHAMVLSLAASVLSVAKAFDKLR